MSDEEDYSDDVPCLSSETMTALQEFLASKQFQEKLIFNDSETQEPLKVNNLEENWQLSQFWYDDETAEELCNEALNEVGSNGQIALIGCPSLYYFFRKSINDSINVKLLDIDKRFKVYGDDFIRYDYNEPIPDDFQTLKNSFDIIILDPPFLSEECFLKCAMTAKFLTKNKIIICTGAVMGSLVKRVLKATKTTFEPKHKSNLANEFCCYINYKSKRLSFMNDS